MLDSYNLRNRVTFPKHIKHHHLDLVIEDQTDTVITHITPGLFLSDHCFTHAILDIVRPWPQRQIVSYQKLRLITQLALVYRQDKERDNSQMIQGETIQTKSNRLHVKCILPAEMACFEHYQDIQENLLC